LLFKLHVIIEYYTTRYITLSSYFYRRLSNIQTPSARRKKSAAAFYSATR